MTASGPSEKGSDAAILSNGPAKWLLIYLFAMTVMGMAINYSLAGVSPHAPDFAAGAVYRVPGPGRHGRDYFVDATTAQVLRFFAAHAFTLAVAAGGLVFWKRIARVPRDGRYGQKLKPGSEREADPVILGKGQPDPRG